MYTSTTTAAEAAALTVQQLKEQQSWACERAADAGTSFLKPGVCYNHAKQPQLMHSVSKTSHTFVADQEWQQPWNLQHADMVTAQI